MTNYRKEINIMKLIQRKVKVKIKDHVIFDNQSYAGMTGVTEYKADNGIW